MTDPLLLPSKSGYLLVEFRFGDPADWTYARYTNWPNPADVAYAFNAELEVQLPANSGVFDEKFTTIALPIDPADDFLVRASRGQPFSRVFVRVWEYVEDPKARLTDPRQTLMCSGQVARVTKGKTIKFEAVNAKMKLSVPLGLQVNHLCPFTLGQATSCKVDLAPLTETGTLAAEDNNKTVRITGLADHAPDEHYWTRGYVDYQGLRIMVRDFDGDELFVMSQRPPDDWYAATVSVVPGCDKTIEVCRARFDNETNFGGTGYGQPSINPIYETS